MLLVSQTGNMTAVGIIRETPKAFIYQDYSMNGSARKKERRLSKDDPTRKLFSSTKEAFDWLGLKDDEDEL